MSAQAGVWNFDGSPVDQAFLGKLGSAIEQYGPDGGNDYIDGSIAMVYRAFHTTLESRLERQPCHSAFGNVIVWDGRLDNRDELIHELRNVLPDEHTDLAIVVAAFERWGTDCFAKFIGDWTLTVWDSRERALILALDYAGVRHLYYYPAGRKVIWCSHLAPLALCGDQFTPCDQYIAGYLAMYPEAHLTPYREIQAVPPGKFVRIRDGKATIHRYGALDSRLEIRHKTDAEFEEHFRHVFRQAVRRRLRSDSPILAELSGGLDSSSIVCMADDIVVKEGVETPRVDTISYYDLKEPDADDASYFSKVEQKRGKTGIHIDVGKFSAPLSFECSSFVPMPGSLGYTQEEDRERSSFIRSGGYRVLLSGIGGDEFLGGIPDPRPQLADLIVRFRLLELQKQLIVWSLAKRRPWIQLLFQAVAVLLPPSIRTWVTREANVEPWIDVKFARRHRLSRLKLGPSDGYGLGLPSRQEYARTLVAMTWQMASTPPHPNVCLENRYPFLDQTLVEFVISIPANQLLRPLQRRSLMRRALVDFLPGEILARQTKATASRASMVALEKHWDTLENLISSPLSSRLGYINQSCFEEALRATKIGKMPAHLVRLLRGLSLESWLRDAARRGVIAVPNPVPVPASTGLLQLGA